MIEKIFVIGCIVIVAGVCIWLGMYINSPSNQADDAAWARYRKRKVSFEAKLMDVMVNHAKWSAAEEWCRLRGVNWFIANEKNMGRLFHYDVRL